MSAPCPHCRDERHLRQQAEAERDKDKARLAVAEDALNRLLGGFTCPRCKSADLMTQQIDDGPRSFACQPCGYHWKETSHD